MKQIILKWLGVKGLETRVAHAEKRLSSLSGAIDEKLRDLDRLTREDWDVGARGPSTVILTGVYRGRGYVKFYDVPAEEFGDLVEMFRERRRHHLIRNIDCPPVFDGSFDMGGRHD